MSKHAYEVDPEDIPILIEALEGIADRNLDVNRILLGAQIVHRKNTVAFEEREMAEWQAELATLPTFDPRAIPPPQAFPSGG